ncbi:non-ribosomal peptide synthetase [Photobacterium galatheae]|uniref:Carrier domain-containing protein n=1 Tax=Photobacterium galatheae TaxID=1654360 RepID=A0A066RHT0_9GAMM|nr:acyl carrier protein [Photobacterium galatheae]KDM90010.1 hypothetical protein EA58_18885 [Photobacterium galatheae]MCM0149991.1 hypothetical protein [Photobacterium galatheae]
MNIKLNNVTLSNTTDIHRVCELNIEGESISVISLKWGVSKTIHALKESERQNNSTIFINHQVLYEEVTENQMSDIKDIIKFNHVNVIQSVITKVFQDCLDNVSLQESDDFFENGGHSLSAMNLAEKLTLSLRVNIDLVDIYRYRTPKVLAKSITEKYFEIKQLILSAFQSVLGDQKISDNDDFFISGGHTFQASQLVENLQSDTDININPYHLFRYRSPAALASFILTRDHNKENLKNVVNMGGKGHKSIYLVHSINGTVKNFEHLATELTVHGEVFGIQASGLRRNEAVSSDMEFMISNYLEQILNIEKRKEKNIITVIGYSFGSFVAHEIACRLEKQGYITKLVLIDIDVKELNTPWDLMHYIDIVYSTEGLVLDLNLYKNKNQKECLEILHQDGIRKKIFPISIDYHAIENQFKIRQGCHDAMNNHVMSTFNGHALYISAEDSKFDNSANDWHHYINGTLLKKTCSGDHLEVLSNKKYVKDVAQEIIQYMEF